MTARKFEVFTGNVEYRASFLGMVLWLEIWNCYLGRDGVPSPFSKRKWKRARKQDLLDMGFK